MKYILIILLFLVSVNIYAQDEKPAFDGHKWEAPYHLPIPKGWGIERFLIPISFAPQIPYKGVEDIRFTPGWANDKTDEYWTYSFLWYLDGNIKINTKIIEENLTNYYTGLFLVNTDSATAADKKFPPVVTSFKKNKKVSNSFETYTGTIQMTDYMKRTPITLNCIVHLRYCAEENKTIIFHELSPKPLDDKVWLPMIRLWLDFKCRK